MVSASTSTPKSANLRMAFAQKMWEKAVKQ